MTFDDNSRRRPMGSAATVRAAPTARSRVQVGDQQHLPGGRGRQRAQEIHRGAGQPGVPRPRRRGQPVAELGGSAVLRPSHDVRGGEPPHPPRRHQRHDDQRHQLRRLLRQPGHRSARRVFPAAKPIAATRRNDVQATASPAGTPAGRPGPGAGGAGRGRPTGPAPGTSPPATRHAGSPTPARRRPRTSARSRLSMSTPPDAAIPVGVLPLTRTGRCRGLLIVRMVWA
jgi:hypothetical protein